MATWMDHETYASQFGGREELDNHRVPRPDEFPETPKESRSYWIKEYPIDLDQKCASHPVSDKVDIVIIGSGITGAVAAYQVSEKHPEYRVAMFEARGICTGATGRNGGFIARPECYHICKTAKILGAEETIRLRKFGNINRDMMVECIQQLGATDEVDLRLKGNVIVFETAEERDAAVQDIDFANHHGFQTESYYLQPDEAAKKFNLNAELCKFGAAHLERAGTFYPRKFVHLLLRTALERMPNLTIHPYTPVEAVTQHNDAELSYQVRTTKGTTNTRAVFHATNAYAGNLCPDLKGSNGVFGVKAHLLAMKPNVAVCTEQLSYGFGYADCWHYLHQRPNHGEFLYGLADAETLYDYNDVITLPAEHPIRPKMARFLESNFAAWFQNVNIAKDVTHDWTGIQGLTLNGASIVGRPTLESPGEFASVGHNGEGMGRCFASGVVATDALLAYLEGATYTAPDWFPACYKRNL